MSVVAYAKGQTLTALQGSDMTFKTDPYPVGGANYAMVVMNLHTIFYSAGSAMLTWQVQGSNDGENFEDISGFTDAETTTGVASQGGDMLYAFMRMKFTFAAGGTSGDWGAVCFDCHVNLMQK